MERRFLGWAVGHAARLCAIAASACALGCSSEPEEANRAAGGSAAAPIVIASVCPSCEPGVGGESSDFEGGLDDCYGHVRRRAVADEQAQALGFDIAGVRRLVEREFSAPLRWSEVELQPLVPWPTPSAPPSGFLPDASIHGVVTAASEMVVADLDPEFCDAAGNCSFSYAPATRSCAAIIASVRSTLELTLVISTSDRAIEAATLRGVTSLAPGETPGVPFAVLEGDLALVQGALRISPGSTEAHYGRLAAGVAFWPAEVRGELVPEVYSGQRPPVSNGYPDDSPIVPRWRYAPVTASWPGDGCRPAALPIDEPSAESRAALDRMAAEYPAAEARVNGTPPLAGGWQAPDTGSITPTAIGVALIGDARPSCVDANGTPEFEVDVRVWSEEGRLDWTLAARGQLRRDPREGPLLVLSSTEFFASDAAFWSENLRGVDLLGAAAAEVPFDVYYGLDDGADAVQGQLEVRVVPDCARDYRCGPPGAPSAGGCAECGAPTPVTQLHWGR